MANDFVEDLNKIRAGAKILPFGDVPPPDAPPPCDEGPMEEDEGPLPPTSAVQPLGISGELYHYLDEQGQLRSLKAKDHSRLNIQSLFGRQVSQLYDTWPAKKEDKDTGQWKVVGWKPELAAESLMVTAAHKGVWSPTERVRGSGAWMGADGELILHVGDKLLIADDQAKADDVAPWREIDPGVVDGMVYPTAPAILRPSMERQAPGAKGVAQELLDLFSTWSLRRENIDAHLLLGWVGAAMLGGALGWRPMIWLTGGFGTGKSTLQDAIRWMMEAGIIHTSDPTPAGIRQLLKHSSIPVAIDEGEPDEQGSARMNGMIKLARDAATGALSVRGGSDHEATTFTLRSCFLFGSILIPPLLPQDRSRLAIIELDMLKPNAPKPKISPRICAALGARLLRRLIDAWPRVNPAIDAYRVAMGEVGHSARGQDVFGTLLGIADVLLTNDLPDTDTLDMWKQQMPADTLAETGGVSDDAAACLSHLLTSSIESVNRGTRETVGWWIARAAGIQMPGDDDDTNKDMRRVALRTLNAYGMTIKSEKRFPGVPFVGIAHKHTGLSKLYAQTQWGSRPGADGVWRQSLDRLSDRHGGDKECKSTSIWVGGSTRATILPLHICLPREVSIEAMKASAERMDREA